MGGRGGNVPCSVFQSNQTVRKHLSESRTLYSRRQHAAGGILEAHVDNLALALQHSLRDTSLRGLLAVALRALVLLAARRIGLDILPAELALVPVDTRNVMRLAGKSK